MNDMNKEMLAAGIRWLLTIVGAWLANKGIADNNMVTTLVGGAGPLSALLWSVYQKRQQAQAVMNALYTPKPPGPVPDGVTPLPQPVSVPQDNGKPFQAAMIALFATFATGCQMTTVTHAPGTLTVKTTSFLMQNDFNGSYEATNGTKINLTRKTSSQTQVIADAMSTGLEIGKTLAK